MKRAATLLAALVMATAANAATVRTATEAYVTNKIAAAVAALPAPDFTMSNATLVATIEATAPAPGNYSVVSNRAMNAITIDAIDYWIDQKRDRGDVTADGWLLIGPDGKHELLWYFFGNEQVSAWYSSDISKYITRVTIDSDVSWSLSIDTYQTTAFYPADATELTFTYDSTNTYTVVRVNSRLAFMSDVTAAAAELTNYTDRAISAIPAGVTPGAVTNIVNDAIRAQSLGGIWDAQLEVWWTPVMSNGALTYQATTNVNLNTEN